MNKGAILIADDEEIIRILPGKTLAKMDYSVISAENGLQVVELFRRPSTEIRPVILDILMPVLDGLAAAETMRRISPETGIVLSGGHEASIHRALISDYGADAIPYKPYRIGDLTNIISSLLAGEDGLVAQPAEPTGIDID